MQGLQKIMQRLMEEETSAVDEAQGNQAVELCPKFDDLQTCLHKLLQMLHKFAINRISTSNGELLIIDTPKAVQNARRYIELFCDKEGALEKKDLRKLKISTYLLLMNDEANHVGRDKRMQLLKQYGFGRGRDVIDTYEVKIPCQMRLIPTRFCGHCHSSKKQGGLLKCGKCMTAYYCDARCQKLAWSNHKHSCAVPATKLKFLEMKMHLAWKALFSNFKAHMFDWLDEIEQKYKQKSRAILLVGVEPAEDGVSKLLFSSVSLRFFTSFTNPKNLQQKKDVFLTARAQLDQNPDALLLAIPFDGYFQFFFL